MIKIGIVGGTGYTGVELLRLLLKHPEAQLVKITSRSDAGKSIAEIYPNLRGHLDLVFSEPTIESLSACDLVFFATPNGTAMRMVPDLLANGVKVIDLAADFRLRDPDVWEQWYGERHACAELLDEAVYGLPEINRSAIRGARLIAMPGCYPTSVLLGFLPLIEGKLISTTGLVADAKSGVSGAGRKATTATMLTEASENFKAYNVQGHRHLPEILQGFAMVGEESAALTFTPHLIPMIRGIHATLYARLKDPDIDLQAVYSERYGEEPFVDVLPSGTHPETRSVRGTNVCRIAVHRPQQGNVVVVLSVIDNLVKGAAGQAVQAMNIMYDFGETTGLDSVATLP